MSGLDDRRAKAAISYHPPSPRGLGLEPAVLVTVDLSTVDEAAQTVEVVEGERTWRANLSQLTTEDGDRLG